MQWVMGGNRMHGVREQQDNGFITRAMCGLSIYGSAVFELVDAAATTPDLCKSCLKIDKKNNEPVVEERVVWQNGLS